MSTVISREDRMFLFQTSREKTMASFRRFDGVVANEDDENVQNGAMTKLKIQYLLYASIQGYTTSKKLSLDDTGDIGRLVLASHSRFSSVCTLIQSF